MGGDGKQIINDGLKVNAVATVWLFNFCEDQIFMDFVRFDV